MRATMIYGAGDIRVEQVPDARVQKPTDALVRVTHTCICGSDLWPYKGNEASEHGQRIGHEFIGIVEDVGKDVQSLSKNDLVVAPFVYSDGTCEYCAQGWTTSCEHGGMWGSGDVDGAQGEAVRVPHADGTLVKLPVAPDTELMPSLLTLSDVFSTGHHAAFSAGVHKGSTVAVVGDGAVGLSAVLAAKRLGAEQIVIMGRHKDRTDIAQDFGATDVVAERGEEGAERVRELTGGAGVSATLECVGTNQALDTCLDITRPGGTVGRVGAPQYEAIPSAGNSFMRNISVVGGIAPARSYIPELLPEVLSGKLTPGVVFDRTMGLDEVATGYQEMDERRSLKVLITP